MTISLRQQALRNRSCRRNFFLSKQKGIPLYGEYFFDCKERCLYGALSVGVVLFFSYFFYKSIYASCFLFPIGIYSYVMFQREKGAKRKRKLEEEFKDCILSVTANLQAGYAVETAFIEARKDMLSLYGKKGLMQKELYRIDVGVKNNIPLSKLLQDMADRSGSIHIQEFSDVFGIATRSGGNLPEIIQETARIIGEEMALKQEIRIMISGRCFEQKIMNVMPFFILCYIEMGNRGYFHILYDSPLGRVIMTICLVVYLLAYVWSNRICKLNI